jgi:lipase chaperone LimK
MARSVLVAAAAVVALAVFWTQTGRPSASPSRRDQATRPVMQASDEVGRREAIAATLRRAPRSEPDRPELPGSLRDTETDGALAIDGDGELIVAPELRRFFEYFFVASGEEADERIRARIEAEIGAYLSGDPQRRALDLVDRYITYRERGRALADTASSAELAERADALRRLREDSFGAQEAAALFADEDAVYAVAVEQRRVAADPTLDDDERAERLAALEASLPDAVRDARAAVTAPLRLAREEAALREAGGSPQEVHSLREQSVGREAAERLAALDQRRTEWQARMDAYRYERAAIDRNAALGVAQREAALEALRLRHFDANELARARALDRIEQAVP